MELNKIRTKQHMYDYVGEFLIKQGKRSGIYSRQSEDFECRYRYHDLKCAIGCLIPDEMYNREMEGTPVDTMVYFVKSKNLWTLPKYMLGKNRDFLTGLQMMHDDPGNWDDNGFNFNIKNWIGFGKTFGLKTDKFEQWGK